MNTVEILKSFEGFADAYLTALEGYTTEQFTKKPATDEWSLGQMYNHLINSGLFMQIKSIEQCASEQAVIGEGKSDAGEQILAAGEFPSIAIKVPDSPQYTPANPASMAEVKERLLHLLEKMREIEPAVASIPADRTAPHPRLGHLNAMEWFQLVPMHFAHHLRQKARLDAFVGKE